MYNDSKNHDLKSMFLAKYVKNLVEPYVAKGTMSKRRIYIKEIARRVPISLSTFYKYMRMSVDNYDSLMADYARIQCERVEHQLRELNERRRRKRLAAAKAEDSKPSANSKSAAASRAKPAQTDEPSAMSAACKSRLAASDIDRNSPPIPKKPRKSRSAAVRIDEQPTTSRPLSDALQPVPSRQSEPVEA